MSRFTGSWFCVSLLVLSMLTGFSSAGDEGVGGADVVTAAGDQSSEEGGSVKPKTLVMVNGESLTDQQATYMINATWVSRPEQAVEVWVDTKLRAKEARRIGLDKGEEISFMLDLMGEKYLSWMLAQHRENNVPVVTEEELRKIYEATIESYKNPFRATIQHITVVDRKLADKIIEDAKSGGSFGKLVKKHSLSGDKRRRGRIGAMTRQKLMKRFGNKELAEAVVTGQKNDILGPYVGKSGFEVIKIAEVRPARVTPFEDAMSGIKYDVMSRRVRENTDKLMKRLKAEADIVRPDKKSESQSEPDVTEKPVPAAKGAIGESEPNELK